MKFFTSAQTKQAEEHALRLGMNHLRLMENAGSAAARIIREKTEPENKKIAVVCGKGNNGGDGFVAARKLYELGAARVTVILALGPPATGDAAEMFSRVRPLGVPVFDHQADEESAEREIANADIIVDAVFGTGLNAGPDERIARLFRLINRSAARIVSLDMPSGADCDSGEVEGESVRAWMTITFSALKPGHAVFPAAGRCGQVVIAGIGMPDEALDAVETNLHAVDREMIKNCMAPRDPEAHKGSFGRALLLCGSAGLSGAAALAAQGALRCGAGLVELAVPKSIYPILASSLYEPVMTPLPEASDGTAALAAFGRIRESMKNASAMLFGCGLGKGFHLRVLTEKIVEAAACPLVIDADGINALACDINIIRKAKAPVILTPHPGEMARLLGVSAQEVQAARLECARDFAAQYGVILILKGANTIVALPDGTVFINMTGNAGMATGGSGDVLSGMTVSFLAQGMKPHEAAFSAVYLHGLAGDACAKRLSQRAMLPGDIVAALPGVFSELEAAL